MKDNKFIFISIVFSVATTTMSQGLIIPLLASLESKHTNILLNSLSTSIIYLGLFISMFFMEQVVKHLGLKNTVCVGLGIGMTSILLFLMYQGFYIWLLFRFLFGLALGAVHYGTQTWIGLITSSEKRGKQMAIYGFLAGVGFAIGPLWINTFKIAEWIPFAIAASGFLISLLAMIPLQNYRPLNPSVGRKRSFKISKMVYFIASPALFMVFVFGFMESSLNGGLPIFAHHEQINISILSLALSAFVVGSLVLQIPLGHISDIWGRRIVLLFCAIVGCGLYGVLPYTTSSSFLFILMFFLTGGTVGSLFSLSLAYLNDLLRPLWLPLGNRLAVMTFGLSMALGPFISALAMRLFTYKGLFWSISLLFLAYFIFNIANKSTVRCITREMFSDTNM
ncbi:MFS transporter [Saccharococcus caldoxylosilyticus]|uniref:Major facilitator superfamily (MFS) profile domain-containing protein n=2 Tax=Bacillales TaxID=1385 RepID=A0A150LXY9_9BACL|nr:MFS transporter [Parageobacillus caldoxylosilyticus]KYD16842.1 hypothetical protein B4119_0548 [Parageobacillus caldoxylosilyticus]